MTDFGNKKRILIVGLPKSGTTILTYRIAAGIPGSKVFFEPGKERSLTDLSLHKDILSHPNEEIISKCLLIPFAGQNVKGVEKFYNKKIWIYRDPRDWIISRFLYKWKNLDGTRVNKFITQLEKKERNPKKVNFFAMMNKNFVQRSIDNYNVLINCINELSEDWLIVKYEDFVDHKLEPLNNYLNINIDPQVEVAEKYNRVVRSKSYGSWREWFNTNDVEFFKPKLSPILKSLGYDSEDWNIEDGDFIQSTLGSDYVKKLAAQKSTSS